MHDIYCVLVRDTIPNYTLQMILSFLSMGQPVLRLIMICTHDSRFYLGFVCPGSGDVCCCGQLSTCSYLSKLLLTQHIGTMCSSVYDSCTKTTP